MAKNLDLREYWRKVREAASSLPETVFLTSIGGGGNRAGVVMEFDRETAARAIVDETHRLAESDEIKAAKAEDEQRRKGIADEEYKRKQHFAMPEELRSLLTVAAKGLVKSGDAKKEEK